MRFRQLRMIEQQLSMKDKIFVEWIHQLRTNELSIITGTNSFMKDELKSWLNSSIKDDKILRVLSIKDRLRMGVVN